MLTIDWKERLRKDTIEYLQKKLPQNDFDFEIIFIAYPERVNGKIPPQVIVHVANSIVKKLGKNHEKYLHFYKHLWDKKGETGRTAFIAIMAKLVQKKPAVYLPMVQKAVNNAHDADLASIFEKVMLPLLRKQPEEYLSYAYDWTRSGKELVRKQAVNLLIKLLKRNPELSEEVVQHFVNQWLQPLDDLASNHVTLLKAVQKLDWELYLDVWRQHDQSRDPQSAEILCASLQSYHPEIEETVVNWTKSGNARLKKAAVAAQRILLKKKPA
ncbi:MAG TPA: DNA alkylation repair protein [Candidatus Syntrophosphaera sp.]|nr:DNA alkylation repair protein [Candidatus Syntrophosphaera sp.]